MAVHVCRRCKVCRSREPDALCPVCALVAELRREHLNGEHATRANASCITCTRGEIRRRREAADAHNEARRASHAECTHPNTKTARTACRARRKRNAG